MGEETITIGVDENEDGIIFQIPTKADSCIKPIGALNYRQKLDQIQAGDWLDIAWPKKEGAVSSHAVIFIKWLDEEKKEVAQIFDWMGEGGKRYAYRKIPLTENTHPVYFYKNPVSSG